MCFSELWSPLYTGRIKMSSFSDKISKLNKDADGRSVIESIDLPIRDLVIEFNRIGIRTVFSCCGFTYDGEEEPKAHHRDTYVAFLGPNMSDFREVSLFFKVVSLARSKGWWVGLLSMNDDPSKQEWIVSFTPQNLLWAMDDDGKSIHNYETRLIAIRELTLLVKGIETAPWIDEIVDGNRYRAQTFKNWQVRPKKSVSISELVK